MTINSTILLSFSTVVAAAGQLLFKIGAAEAKQFTDFVNMPILFGLVLYGVGTAIWIYALSSEMLVNVYAFTALTFVLVYAGGLLLLGETISQAALIGVLLILLGLYLIAAHGG